MKYGVVGNGPQMENFIKVALYCFQSCICAGYHLIWKKLHLHFSLLKKTDIDVWQNLADLYNDSKNYFYNRAEMKIKIEETSNGFATWYDVHNLSLKLPNFHHLRCHVAVNSETQCPPYVSTTQVDERFHQIPKRIIQNNVNGHSFSIDVLQKVNSFPFLLLFPVPDFVV